MIQRIQTLFLLLAFMITGLLFFFPVATISMTAGSAGELSLSEFYTSRYLLLETPPVLIDYNWFALSLNILITGLAFFTIFCYKKRFLQLRLCLVNIILMVGLLILIAVQAYNISKPDGEWHFMPGYSFPIVGIILTWLASRGIMKDILLLKSYDRIR